jgi:hypothetical protein
MNRGTKTGFSTISLERLQCARRDFADPTERRRSGDGFNGGSDSYLQFRNNSGKSRNMNLILDVTP